jgi:FAD dependent oxidoreductase
MLVWGRRTWTGIEGCMPDMLPVVGPSMTTPGLLHAFGFSGHGFQLGPAVGAVLAELALDGRTATAKNEVSETRAILLLILGHTEHLWIQIKIVFVKARMSSKKKIGSNCYEANFLCYNDPLQNQE